MKDDFKSATLRQYGNMRTRFKPKFNLAGELTKPGRALPFTLDGYRRWVQYICSQADGLRCSYCERKIPVTALSPDHVLPVKRGGSIGLENLNPSCQECNRAKGQLTGDEFMALREFLDSMDKAARNYVMGCLKQAAMGSRMRFFPRDVKTKQPTANLKVKKDHPNAILFKGVVLKLSAIAMLFVALGCVGCTSEDEATRVLRSQGYTEIQITGYRAFTCSNDDSFHTGFRARTQAGVMVTGTVCSGLLKGATVRMD